MKTIIRPMQPTDARGYLETHRLAVLGIAAADYPEEVIRTWAASVTDASIAALLRNPDDEIRVVAEWQGEIVGFAALVAAKHELRACYVCPRAARRGIGTALVRELERIARDRGLDRLEFVSSLTAEPFYRRLGYAAQGSVEHTLSSGIEMAAVAMHKTL